MTHKTQVGLMFGGTSSEYQISIKSAHNIYREINKDRFAVHPIWITNDGYFADEKESFKVLRDPNYQVKYSHQVKNLSNLIELAHLPEIDIFFPIVHGNLGEDGTLQGLFKLLDKPYVGSGILGAALTMDKELTKIVSKQAGVPVADWITVKRTDYEDPANKKLDYAYVKKQLGPDLFVKPSAQGSSVGISHVLNAAAYRKGLAEAFKYDDKVLVERTVHGTEMEVAVLGNDHPLVSGAGQIINAKGTWYSYANKFGSRSQSVLQIPAQLPKKVVEQARKEALKVFQVTECAGLARIDFMLQASDQQVIMTEANALPGFTDISMYPKLFEQAGITYSDLITRLIETGLKRFAHKKTLLHKYQEEGQA